jgi:hypothetical protein
MSRANFYFIAIVANGFRISDLNRIQGAVLHVLFKKSSHRRHLLRMGANVSFPICPKMSLIGYLAATLLPKIRHIAMDFDDMGLSFLSDNLGRGGVNNA